MLLPQNLSEELEFAQVLVLAGLRERMSVESGGRRLFTERDVSQFDGSFSKLGLR
jgi:hypothetical protein